MRNLKSVITLSCITVFFSLSALTARAKSTLWKISSKKGTLYIQGSAHILKADNYPLAAEIEEAYTKSSALVLEVDMGEMLSPKTQQLIMGKAMLKQPDTLKTILSPVVYEKLEKASADAKLPLAAFEQFKPWFTTMTLTIMQMKQMGLNEELGLDRHFYTKAVADKKKVIGLETIDFQIALFDSLSDENPDEFVSRSLMELDQIEADLTNLLNAWEQGNTETIDALINKSFSDYPEQYEKFITNRNKAWVKQLSDLIKNGETTMVVVGAGHLCGDESVINLLQIKGFTAEQL